MAKYPEIIARLTDKALPYVRKVLKVEYKDVPTLKEFIDAVLIDFIYPIYVYILTHDYDNRIEIDNNRCKRFKKRILCKQYIHVHYNGGKKYNNYDLCLLDVILDYIEGLKEEK